MFRRFLIAGFLAIGSQVNAADCPSYYRFVEFGLQDENGQHLRGGPIFRGEGFDGRSLLDVKDTTCRPIRDMAVDGHGHPIPIVTRVSYDVQKTGMDLVGLRVSYSADALAAAETNTGRHRDNLVTAKPIKGQNSLCVIAREQMSCQVVSPYKNDAGLVVYCDLSQCHMPVLAVGPHILISAEWVTDPGLWLEDAGDEIFKKVTEIHAFFEPLTSGL